MFLVHILLGWFLADLGTALIHLFMDRVFGTWMMRLPWLGGIIRDFELHHREPAYFLQGSFWYSNRENLIAGALLAVPTFFCLPWLFGSLAIGVMVAQESHRWSHRQPVPALVRFLQRCRVMLPPATHNRHHSSFSRNYSILCGWSNPVLNAVLTLVGA